MSELDESEKQTVRNLFPMVESGIRSLFPPVQDLTNTDDIFGTQNAPPASNFSGVATGSGNTTDITGQPSTAEGTSWNVSSGNKLTWKSYRQVEANDGGTIGVATGSSISTVSVVVDVNYTNHDCLANPTGGAIFNAAVYGTPAAVWTHSGTSTFKAAVADSGTSVQVAKYVGATSFVTSVGPPPTSAAGVTNAGSISAVPTINWAAACPPNVTTPISYCLQDNSFLTTFDASLTTAQSASLMEDPTLASFAQIADPLIVQFQPIKVTIFSRTWVANFDGTLKSVTAETEERHFTIYKKV